MVFAVSLLATGCGVAKKADQTLYEVTEAVSERDTVTGARSVSLLDREGQIDQGNTVAERILTQLQEQEAVVLNEEASPTQYARMQRIFERVHSVSHLRDEDWTAVLTSSPQFNAFVTGGTYMVVHLGLMEALTDDQVAAVFGHEIAHVAANHVGEAMGHAQLATLAGSESVDEDGFGAAFSHEQEAEADRIGILYAALAGYSPDAAAEVWQEKFAERGNLRGVSVYHSHPVNSERAAMNEEIATKVERYYTPGEVNADFAGLLEDNTLYRTRGDDYAESAGQGGGLAAMLETVANAAIQHERAKAEQERQERRAQFVRSVQAAMEIIGYRTHSATTWELGFRYRGGVPLEWVTVRARLPSKDGEWLPFVEKVEGPVHPGATFGVTFMHEALPAELLTPEYGQFMIDDAEPL